MRRFGMALLLGLVTGSLGSGLFRVGDAPNYETFTPGRALAYAAAIVATASLGYLAGRADGHIDREAGT